MVPNLTETDLAAPAGRAFQSIARAWGMTEAEQLAILAVDTPEDLANITAGERHSHSAETLHRISHILCIFKAIHTLLPQSGRADAWMRKPNKAPLFGGGSALALMTSGQMSDLDAVQRYLEAEVWGN